jgi:hypothetical protein
MLTRARARTRRRGVWLAFVGVLACAPPARAADALYRIFLRDGSTVVSFGEYARVADRVVFSIPLGEVDGPSPTLHLVTIAESSVDWERTDRYREAVQAQHYAATRGEADFDRLSTDVARALNDVSKTKDPTQRLAMAEAARRMLADWPASHHGYRAADVAQLSALLDEVVSELRVAAGQSRFDLSLVAPTPAPPTVITPLPPPTLRESIEHAFRVATVTPEPTERVSLLRAIADSLEPNDNEEDATWMAALHAKATAELASELRTDKAYQDLVTRTLATADQRAQRADVAGIETLVREVLKADDRLGRRRPQTTASLLATLDARLDSARRLRLARDAWGIRQAGVRAYQRQIQPALDRFRRSTTWLERIRQLSGPAPSAVAALVERLETASRLVHAARPPAEAQAAHGVLVSALQLAARAAAARQLAIVGANMDHAWEASSAAAGALLLFDRAREELQKLNTPPGL